MTWALALVASSAGFGAGWVAHRHSAMYQLQPYRVFVQPAKTSPLLCTSDLADAEHQCPGASLAIVAETPYQYRIDRRAVICLLSSPVTRDRLLANLQLLASPGNGVPDGVRIFGVRAGSLPARLGLRNGDLIRRVNGISVNSEDGMRALYRRFRSASFAMVEVERSGPQGRALLHLRYHVAGVPM